MKKSLVFLLLVLAFLAVFCATLVAFSFSEMAARAASREQTIESASLVDFDPVCGVYHIAFGDEVHEYIA